MEAIESMPVKPRVLLGSITTVADKEVQKEIRKLQIRVIAIDEAQVSDWLDENGHCRGFRKKLHFS